MSKLCDHFSDCPNGDDELNCKSIGTINNSESKFQSDQYGPVNINIVNRDSGNIFKQPNFKNQLPKNESNNDEDITNQWITNDKDNHQKQYEDETKLPLVQDGVGFQFRVNNFVIYNSQVKMFDQDSDNVGINEDNEGNRTQKHFQTQRPINKSKLNFQ